VFANDRVLTMFGGPAPMVGKSFLEVVRMQPLADAFAKAMRGESSAERFTRDDRQIEMRVMPVSASTEVAAVALFIDISQMEKLQRMRREFLDDFSHEVRTPLAGLRSAAETFEHGPLTPPQEQQLRRVILRQLARIERLVKDLSELSRIESGELVLEPSIVDLRQLLAELCDDFRERTPARITIQGQSARASVDPPRVQQVFANLLDNASKYGGEGEILVEVIRENGQAVVRVSDEGEGIPPGELERIFQRFYRIDKSRSQEIAGVGLGLSIAKHLVLLHGGSIRAYNRPTGGATFEVRLPAVG
jgi:two-component system, OmpR family, phosphate regulon sensor histidine kinase PhoR